MPAAIQAKPPPAARHPPEAREGIAPLVSALAIPGCPEHVKSARKFTDFVLALHGHDDEGTTALLVSELVTNSLEHSDSGKPGGTITITVAIMPGEILIEVTDDGGATRPVPCPANDDDDAEDGRGLYLVQELADDWGYHHRKGWLVTWFKLRTGTPPS